MASPDSTSAAALPNAADAPYWAALADGRLLLPRCGGCAQWIWPAAHRCPHCASTDVHWHERPMQARVFSWTRTWHRFHLTETLPLPYVSIVAEIADCGIRLLGRLDDPDRIDPRLGEAVHGRPATTMVENRAIPTIVWSRTQ